MGLRRSVTNWGVISPAFWGIKAMEQRRPGALVLSVTVGVNPGGVASCRKWWRIVVAYGLRRKCGLITARSPRLGPGAAAFRLPRLREGG